jgi:hypothetical protein
MTNEADRKTPKGVIEARELISEGQGGQLSRSQRKYELQETSIEEAQKITDRNEKWRKKTKELIDPCREDSITVGRSTS